MLGTQFLHLNKQLAINEIVLILYIYFFSFLSSQLGFQLAKLWYNIELQVQVPETVGKNGKYKLFFIFFFFFTKMTKICRWHRLGAVQRFFFLIDNSILTLMIIIVWLLKWNVISNPIYAHNPKPCCGFGDRMIKFLEPHQTVFLFFFFILQYRTSLQLKFSIKFRPFADINFKIPKN